MSLNRANLRLYDNTRLSDYKRCPRFFFYRHVMDWVSTGERRVPLVFGSAWHTAMDRLWAGVNSRHSRETVIDSAYGAFIVTWIKEGMPPPSEIDLSLSQELLPRTPGRALEMLENYYDKRQQFILSATILDIERPFAVPLSPSDPTLFYVGRIDKVLAPDKKSVRGIEHKTTTAMRLNTRKEQTISGMFKESFSPNSQVDGYLYALDLLYPDMRTDVYVDAVLVHKLGEDAAFIPQERQPNQLDMWLWETHYWIDRIEEDKARLNANDQSPYMNAFAKNTNSCFDFNTSCEYLDLCRSRPNPLTWQGEPPQGYKEQHWDPLDHIGTPRELA
jgi:hypothetical protein